MVSWPMEDLYPYFYLKIPSLNLENHCSSTIYQRSNISAATLNLPQSIPLKLKSLSNRRNKRFPPYAGRVMQAGRLDQTRPEPRGKSNYRFFTIAIGKRNRWRLWIFHLWLRTRFDFYSRLRALSRSVGVYEWICPKLHVCRWLLSHLSGYYSRGGLSVFARDF